MAGWSASKNFVPLTLIIVSKIFGVLGLALGVTDHRVIGAVFLSFAFLFIAITMVICVRAMKQRERQDTDEKKVLARMVREGTLKEFLREIEAEAKENATPTEQTEPASPGYRRAYS